MVGNAYGCDNCNIEADDVDRWFWWRDCVAKAKLQFDKFT